MGVICHIWHIVTETSGISLVWFKLWPLRISTLSCRHIALSLWVSLTERKSISGPHVRIQPNREYVRNCQRKTPVCCQPMKKGHCFRVGNDKRSHSTEVLGIVSPIGNFAPDPPPQAFTLVAISHIVKGSRISILRALPDIGWNGGFHVCVCFFSVCRYDMTGWFDPKSSGKEPIAGRWFVPIQIKNGCCTRVYHAHTHNRYSY